jgi:hypothetical protein
MEMTGMVMTHLTSLHNLHKIVGRDFRRWQRIKIGKST